MARTTARVEQETLISPTPAAGSITVGTPAWFAWLESATTFSFSGPTGSFTARKEGRARGGGYWKAYRTAHGPFAQPEDVKRVSGIGDAIFEKIRPYITVGR